MGLTLRLAFLYIVLIALTVLSFIRRKTAVAVLLLAATVVSIAVLVYLWITSPM